MTSILAGIGQHRHTHSSLASALFKPLLPNEPRILNPAAEQALTERFLLPALSELEVFFLAVRAQVDPVLQHLQPVKLGKPYPLGQCLEISLAVQKQLSRVDPTQLEKTAAQGHAAFSDFLRAGGTMRQVWGDLRGQFFQNAFQLGALYVDVSNDTVVPTKPKVEILPFADAQFMPIRDYRHFSQIAVRYWQHHIFPNHVLPELAPYCPLIHVSSSGKVRLHSATEYMVHMTLARRFQPSEEVLTAPTMPDDIFSVIVDILRSTSLRLAHNPEHGRKLALQYCRQYRARRWHWSAQQYEQIIQALHKVNLLLANLQLNEQGIPSQPQNRMRPSVEDATHSHSAVHQFPLPSITPPRNSMPGFKIISRTRHAGKRWRHNTDYRFADADALVPLAAQELPLAMMSVPIAFVQENGRYMPVAVQGLANGSNLFVAPDGGWGSAYLPAAYRIHPFALASTRDGQQALCIDESSGLLSDVDGELFFNEDGQPAQGIVDILNFLTQLHSNWIVTGNICAALHERGLIEPWLIRLQSAAGEMMIDGLYRINELALTQVPAEQLKVLQESGALSVVYCQLLSMQHIHKLAKLVQCT